MLDTLSHSDYAKRMKAVSAMRGASSMAFPLLGEQGLGKRERRSVRHWIESFIILSHKTRTGQTINPSTFLSCLGFLIISVVVLMHWSWEAGKLKSIGAACQQKNFLCSPLYGYRLQLTLWFEFLSFLRHKKRKGDQYSKESNFSPVETFLGISAARACLFLWITSVSGMLSMLMQKVCIFFNPIKK